MDLRTEHLLRVGIVVVLLGVAVLTTAYAGNPADRDFISYWSAGHLLVHHGNPYDSASVLQLERGQGYAEAKPLIMRNPPWALLLTVPLGWLGVRAGLVAWLATLVGCVGLSLGAIRAAAQDRMLAWAFAPVLASLMAGQSSPFLLLGFSCFVRFSRERPFLAGTALLLMAIKPHLFLIVWPLLVADTLRTRNYGLLVGAGAALTLASVAVMCLDPGVWAHYVAYLRSARIEEEFIPAPAVLLRILIDRKARWLQLLPSCVAMVWAVWFYVRHRSAWDWGRHGLLVMVIAVWVSPYAWMTDEIVLLPAVLAAISGAARPKYATGAYVVATGAVLLMLIAQVPLTSGAYVWTSSAWLALCVYAARRSAMASAGAPNLPGLGPAENRASHCPGSYPR